MNKNTIKLGSYILGTTNNNSEETFNFMGGLSFIVTPITRLKLATSSSFFGEKMYYSPKKIKFDSYDFEDSLINSSMYTDTTNKEYIEKIIDDALFYNFKETLDWAYTLRTEYFIRLTPQVIMVRASIHPDRISFNNAYPKYFYDLNNKIMSRGDDVLNQFSYFKSINNESVKGLPFPLKNSWKKNLETMTPYVLNKYSSKKIKNNSIIDIVRISHANSEPINDLVYDKLTVSEEYSTVAILRSQGFSWKEINSKINLPHMAILRGLKSMLTELSSGKNDSEFFAEICSKLEEGVLTGKQLPFRYWNAYSTIKDTPNLPDNLKKMALTSLNKCIMLGIESMPKLKGKTVTLSDNSGSAWGVVTSEFGSAKVAELGNLSSLITAYSSEQLGSIYVFGDRLIKFNIDLKKSFMENLSDLNELGTTVGMSTESGLFEFFRESIEKSEVWDNIFVYSDMQAGTKDTLYLSESFVDSSNACFDSTYSTNDSYHPYYSVKDLVNLYRINCNSYVNIFTVQTAGYSDSLLPEFSYKFTQLYGWTGKEVLFANYVNSIY